jgi:hypothetical protein
MEPATLEELKTDISKLHSILRPPTLIDLKGSKITAKFYKIKIIFENLKILFQNISAARKDEFTINFKYRKDRTNSIDLKEIMVLFSCFIHEALEIWLSVTGSTGIKKKMIGGRNKSKKQ